MMHAGSRAVPLPYAARESRRRLVSTPTQHIKNYEMRTSDGRDPELPSFVVTGPRKTMTKGTFKHARIIRKPEYRPAACFVGGRGRSGRSFWLCIHQADGI